jgi:spore germination cell wall hydrolase CwlJ-like protein
MALAEQIVLGFTNPDPLFRETVYLAAGVISGAFLDRTGGATSYYAPKAMKPAGAKPSWVYLNGKSGPEHVPTAVVGSQIFYKGV